MNKSQTNKSDARFQHNKRRAQKRTLRTRRAHANDVESMALMSRATGQSCTQWFNGMEVMT